MPPTAHRFWYAAAVLACLLGMATKEVMATAPLVVLLYDRTFLTGSFRESLRRRWGLYLGLAATWGLLAGLVLSTGLLARQPEMGAPDAAGYFRSQPGVILWYLRLAIWPSRLCFDYGWPVADSLAAILPATLAVAVLVAATVWGLIGRKAWGFAGAWFFLILAPTSSILPLGQLAFEHRAYLSLAAVVALLGAGGYACCDRLLPRSAQAGRRAALVRWAAPLLVLTAALVALGHATALRNDDYRTLLAIWLETLNQRPNNSVAHNNVGNILVEMGKTGEAIEHYHQALENKPTDPDPHYNLALALAGLGKSDEALLQFQEALRLKPSYVEAHNNLSLVLNGLGKTDEAIEHLHAALRVDPECAMAHYNLGFVLAGLGKSDEAIAQFREAVRLKPDYAEAHAHLANALLVAGNTDEAIKHLRETLRLKPENAEAHNNLANLLVGRGENDAAIEHYTAALRLKPDYARAHNNLATLLAALGRSGQAIEHYREAVRLKPDYAAALNGLAWLLATRRPKDGGDPAGAVEMAERLQGLGGRENPRWLDTLAAAYAAAGRFPEAATTAQQATRLAESAGQMASAKEIQSRCELYRAGRPYRVAADPPSRPGP